MVDFQNETLWLLKGAPGVPGWGALQIAHNAEKVFVLHFDPDKWALVKAVGRPDGFEGLTVSDPPPGLYLDNFGRPIYVADGKEVHSARAVIMTLGQEADAMLNKLGDADLVLDRLGHSY